MVDVKALGRQRKRYLAFATSWALVAIVLCLLVGALFIAFPVVNGLMEVIAFGTSRIDNVLGTEDFWVPLGCGGVLVLISLGIGLNWALSKPFFIADHELGLVFGHGRKAESTMRWDTLTSMTRSQSYDVKSRVSRTTYTLYTNEKRTFYFSGGISGVDELVKTCQARIDAAVGPTYESLLRSGKRAHFGWMSLDDRAVYIGDFATPWPEVRGVEAGPSSIVVQTKTISADAPQSAPLEKVHNWWILLRLARQYMR